VFLRWNFSGGEQHWRSRSRRHVPELNVGGWFNRKHTTSSQDGFEGNHTKRNTMRNKLLAIVAITTLMGCTSFAVAQNSGREGGGMSNPGGARSTPSGGSAQNEGLTNGPQGSADQGKSVSQENRSKSSTMSNPQGNAQDQNQRGTKEQRGAENQSGAEQRGVQDNDRAGNRMGRDQDQNQGRGDAASDNAQQNGSGARAGGTSVKLSQDQRAKVKDVIVRDRNVARVNSASFSVNVGAKIPRDVHISALPPDVATIVPEYRGFEYVVVGDQLLIIDPNTLEIVDILPA
jgi:hypothetical protein